MKSSKFSFFEKFKKYHFEFKHLLVLLLVLIIFQILVSIVHKGSIQHLLLKTQDWYQQDSAERLANLSATSLELLLETTSSKSIVDSDNIQEIIQAFNIILSQPLLQQSVRDICILVPDGDDIISIDEGKLLFDFFFQGVSLPHGLENKHTEAINLYQDLSEEIKRDEQIYSVREGDNIFHVFVPFVPKGEYVGAVYVKNIPDFTFITSEIISSYDETALIFTALILFGLIAMFYISSYTVKERDEAFKQLYSEREKFFKEEIHHQKEALFTKRIYHTHHKAEKIMGFIKEDLLQLDNKKTDEIKSRVTKYANFISRVIYDMKWYDPPLQTIRNPLFQTDLNEVLRFIVEHIFQRVAYPTNKYDFQFNLDPAVPPIGVNEFVVWEIVEPLIQNSIDHSEKDKVIIRISTKFDPQKNECYLSICDNGSGFKKELLEEDENGIKKLFLENVTTKVNSGNTGYGCYLAYEISTQRCGWKIDAINLENEGCCYKFIIPCKERGKNVL
jgi:signal transduction histidine kinase